ncbi:MAG: leucine-rich repeat domain-containing protein, partial [Ruminococcus sp.]|nr:leucine-rich repeat domain-containing protein [Ruminococcus sp.]
MKKRIFSALCALALVFGSAAAMPNGAVSGGVALMAQALSENGFTYTLLEDGTAEITEYTGAATVLAIPETLGGKKVTSIGENAFYDNASLTSVTIPDSVTNITENAFCRCTALTSVTLPSKLRAIKSFVFSGTGLKSIEIPASVEYIDDYAFMFCADLKTVTLKDGITSLGNGAFWSCTSLESIEMPDTVEYIGSNCFWDCGSLKKATISGGVEEISDAFGDSGLEEVVIQEGTGSIGFYA